MCQGPDKAGDKWALIEEIYNKIRFECFDDEQDCPKTRNIRKAHETLLENVFVNLRLGILRSLPPESLETALQINRGTFDNITMFILDIVAEEAMKEQSFDKRRQRLSLLSPTTFLTGVTSQPLLEPMISHELGKKRHFLSPSIVESIILPWVQETYRSCDNMPCSDEIQTVHQVLQNYAYHGFTYEELAGPCRDIRIGKTHPFVTCTVGRDTEMNAWYTSLLATERAFNFNSKFSGFGTFLAHFLSLEGSSFYANIYIGEGPSLFNQRELEMHGEFADIFSSISNDLVKNVSLLDIPALLTITDRDASGNDWRYQWQTQADFSTHKSPCDKKSLEEYGKNWRDFLDAATEPPCSKNQSLPCCQYWGRVLGSHLEATMTVMRFSSPQGMPMKDKKHLAHLLKDWEFFHQKYNLLSDDETYDYHALNLIPYCSKAEAKDTGWPCHLFKPMLTSEGLCHSYNSFSTSELFADSEYMDIFNRVYNIDNRTSTTKSALGHGDRFGLTLYLDANRKSRPRHNFYGNPRSPYAWRPQFVDPAIFKIGIGHEFGPFQSLKNFVTVEAGKHSFIKVMPSQIISSESLRDLTPQQSQCRFLDENEDLSMITFYTQEGCQFECMLNHSRNLCGCTPWNYPQIGPVDEICDRFGAECFHERMNDIEHVEKCGCLSDCEEVMFTHSDSSAILGFVETSWLMRPFSSKVSF